MALPNLKSRLLSTATPKSRNRNLKSSPNPNSMFSAQTGIEILEGMDLIKYTNFKGKDKNALLSKEVTRLEKELDHSEINMYGATINSEQEFRIYKCFLEKLNSILLKKDKILSAVLTRGIIGCEKAFKKLNTQIRADFIYEPQVLTKKVHTCDMETQTFFIEKLQEFPRFCSTPEMENIKLLPESMKKIKLSRISNQLEDLYESLSSMYTEVPSPTESPEHHHIEFSEADKVINLKLTVIRQNISKILQSAEIKKLGIPKETQTNIDTNRSTVIALEEMNEEKELDVLKLRARCRVLAREKFELEEKVIRMNNILEEIGKNNSKNEIELSHLKHENSSLNKQVSELQEQFAKVDKALEEEENQVSGLRKIVENLQQILKKKQSQLKDALDKLFTSQVFWRVSESKLKKLEKSWEKKTGSGFKHKEIDVELVKNKFGIKRDSENPDEEVEKIEKKLKKFDKFTEERKRRRSLSRETSHGKERMMKVYSKRGSVNSYKGSDENLDIRMMELVKNHSEDNIDDSEESLSEGEIITENKQNKTITLNIPNKKKNLKKECEKDYEKVERSRQDEEISIVEEFETQGLVKAKAKENVEETPLKKIRKKSIRSTGKKGELINIYPEKEEKNAQQGNKISLSKKTTKITASAISQSLEKPNFPQKKNPTQESNQKSKALSLAPELETQPSVYKALKIPEQNPELRKYSVEITNPEPATPENSIHIYQETTKQPTKPSNYSNIPSNRSGNQSSKEKISEKLKKSDLFAMDESNNTEAYIENSLLRPNQSSHYNLQKKKKTQLSPTRNSHVYLSNLSNQSSVSSLISEDAYKKRLITQTLTSDEQEIEIENLLNTILEAEKDLIFTLTNEQKEAFEEYKAKKQEHQVLCALHSSKATQCTLGLPQEFADKLERIRKKEKYRKLLGKVFEHPTEIDMLIPQYRRELAAALKGHKLSRCAEVCEHLKRALLIKMKARGVPYPIKTIKM